MPSALNTVTIKGFKSIRSLENFELANLNVLIGGNGAGKSNFIDFFRLLRAMLELPLHGLEHASLRAYVADNDSRDGLLFNGIKVTPQIEVELHFDLNGYRFKLAPDTGDSFFIKDEERLFMGGTAGWWNLGSGQTTPELLKDKETNGYTGTKNASFYVYHAIESWKIYHFHDSSKHAPMRGYEKIDDCDYLRFEGSNIAPYLFKLREEYSDAYKQIVETVRLVTPFFDDFILKPNKKEMVRLRWRQKGSDYPLNPYHLSDGTIRFICLATALLQPELPSLLILDEPELGLHPYAISILAELIQTAAKKIKLIVATQSAEFVNNFHPEHIVVTNRRDGASVFSRLNTDELSLWLKDYSLGELWKKNIISGGPDYE